MEDNRHLKEQIIDEHLENLKLDLMGEIEDVQVVDLPEDTVFKMKVNSELENFEKDIAEVQKLFQELDTDEFKSKYSEQYQNQRWQEKLIEESVAKDYAAQKVDLLVNQYIKSLEPNTDEINSSLYQMKLNNVLSMAALTGGQINLSSLDFIAEARDMNTLKAIVKGYDNNLELKQYFREHDISKKVEQANYIKDDFHKAIYGKIDDYYTQVAIYNIKNLLKK